MKNTELKLLEKIFAKEIDGGVYQTKRKMAKKLEDEGYIQLVEKHLGRDRLGSIVVKGYVLTIMGNLSYCMSDLVEKMKEINS